MILRSRRARLIVGGVAAAVVAYTAYVQMYGGSAGVLSGEIARARGSVSELSRRVDDHVRVRRQLKAIGAATLSGEFDKAEHRWRSALSRIAEDCGLVGVTFNNAGPRPHKSPVLEAKVPSSLKRLIQDRGADFEVITGTLKGSGSLEAVLKTIAIARAQPWVHRVVGFTIEPEGQNGSRFGLTLVVETLFLPDLAPKDLGDPVVAAGPPEVEAIWRAIAQRNPFREPPAPVVVQRGPEPDPAPVAPTPPVSTGPGYDEWRVTGVVVGRAGVEVWLVNARTQERTVLTPGTRVLDAVFVEGAGERAVFEIDGQKFEVTNGQTLGARRPIG